MLLEINLEIKRRATLIPLKTKGKNLLNSATTKKNHNSAKSLWKTDTVPMKKDVSSLTDSTNSAKIITITPNTKLRNVVVLKTNTSASMETGATSFIQKEQTSREEKKPTKVKKL